MPIDDVNNRGTENDGSKSNEYCRYCYKDGSFISPDMTFDEMRELVIMHMRRMHIHENVIHQSLDCLPHLKRWKKVMV
jgi:hypothetical protein